MPNIKSAMKRVKVADKKAQANRSKRSEMRTQIKKTRTAVAESIEQAEVLFKETQAGLDRAAAKGYFHKNTVARKKSRIAKAINKARG